MFDTINERVAHYRKLANLTQAEAAERMGMKSSTYSQMERKGNISAERIVKLAQIFSVEPSILLFGEPVQPPVKIIKPIDETTVGLKQTPVSPPEPPQPFILTNKEKSIIKIFRTLSKNEKDEVVDFIDSKRKKRK